METELFMECEEEELEPWQQLDDSEEEDLLQLANYCEPVEDCPSPFSTAQSAPPRTPPIAPVSKALPPVVTFPDTSVACLATPRTSAGSALLPMVQGPPLILTQTASGAFLLPVAPGAAPSLLLATQTQMTDVERFRFKDQLGRTFESKGEMVACGVCGGKYFRIVSHLKKSRTCSLHLDLDKFEKLLLLYNRKRKRKCVTKGFPVQTLVSPSPPLLLSLQPGQTVQPLSLIQSPASIPQPMVSQGPALSEGSVLTTSALSSHTCTPGPVHLQVSQVGGANALQLTDSLALSSLSPSGVSRLALISDSRPTMDSAPDVKVTSHSPRVEMSVEEFYYGKFEGDLRLRKSQPLGMKTSTFTCQICTHLAENNLRLMQHMLQHSELITGCGAEEKFCRFCYRHFSSPLQLHTHQEQVHGSDPSSSRCRICEWAFEDELAFLNHMKSNHSPGEMPYICQVCWFRSSFYADILQHFARFHSHSDLLLCVFCLRVTRNPVTYQQHLLSHQVSQAFHCSLCRLQFVYPKDKMKHKLQSHHSFRRPARLEGLPPGSKVTIRTYGKLTPLMAPSSLVQPIDIKTEPQKQPVQVHSELSRGPPSPSKGVRRTSCDGTALVCLECGTDASDFRAHFPSKVHCLLCPYSSCCSRAYATHMIHHHVPQSRDGRVPLHRLSPPCPFLLSCSGCDFRPQSSDLMAHHLLTNPDHHSATCVLTTYIEPDIQFSPGDVQPPLDQDWSDPAGRSAGCWEQPNVAGSAVLPFRHTSGPHHLLVQESDAIDFFNLLFPARLVKLIANETNAHAKTCLFLGSSPTDWHPVTAHEVRGFIGLVVLMGIHNLPEQSHYWSWSHYDRSSTFHQTMSFRRFKQIASMIRMGSFATEQLRGTQNPRDPLHIFRPMLDLLGAAMWEAYNPNCCLTVDRTLLPRPVEQGGAGNSQTQPRVWLLCDSKSGYCHRFFIQVGEEEGVEPGFTVVPELVKGLEDKHHQLYLASCLASVPLVQGLLDQGIYASSSFAWPSPVLPTALWQDGSLNRPGDFEQKQYGGLLATRWRDTKEAFCLSTNAAPGAGDTVWRRSQTKVGGLAPIDRPMAFRLLQENMRGVDICKQLLACNPLGGLAQDRHWRSLFWFLVNLSIVNAFILLRESRKDHPPVWVRDGLFTQVNFRKRLANQLAECAQEECQVSEVSHAPRMDPLDPAFSNRHRMAKISALSKRCRNCNSKNIRRETVYGCFSCKVNLCKEPRCFWEFHDLSPLHKGPTKVEFLKDGRLSGALEVDVWQQVEDMAPVEEMDFSDDEQVEGLDQAEEESVQVEDSHVFLPTAANLPIPPASTPPVSVSVPPREREDFLSARQLRIALFALCDGLRQASHVFSTDTQLIRSWLQEARRREKQRESEENLHWDGVGRMVAWVLSMREQQLPISESALFHKASVLKKKGCFCQSFRISYDWAVSFLLRHRLGVRNLGTSTYELPTFLDSKVAAFKQFTRKVVRVHQLPESCVAAMDELCLFVDLRLVQDKARRSEALELIGSIPLVTVYLAALANGTVLPSLVLSNRQLADKVPSEFVLLESGPENLTLQDALDLWTNKVWLPYLSCRPQPGRSMLVLDRHRDHAGDRFLASLAGTGSLPALIPAGCASCLQPLEVSVKPALQRYMLLRWNHFTAGDPPELEETSPQRLQANVAQLLVDWLVEALTYLNQVPQVWKDSFRISGILLQKEEEEEEKPASVQLELFQSLTDTLLIALNLEHKAPEALELDQEEETEDEATQEEKKEEDDDRKEKGKQADENRKEENKARRETRIAIGDEVGGEWKIKSRTEGEEIYRAKPPVNQEEPAHSSVSPERGAYPGANE